MLGLAARTAAVAMSALKTKHITANSKMDVDHDDEGSLSSLSFYEDFPKLFFAVRRGKYINNSVFSTWDSARVQIVDYPDAEYICTPTLEQAHRYTHRFGEFDESETPIQTDSPTKTAAHTQPKECDKGMGDSSSPKNEEDLPHTSQSMPLSSMPQEPVRQKQPKRVSSSSKDTTQSKTCKEKPSKRNYSTRKLLLEYYELYDPAYKAKGEKPLTIQKFLKQRNMYKSKFKVFCKHWQRSGLLIMSNDEKPLRDAVVKYDGWVRARKLDLREKKAEEQKAIDKEENEDDGKSKTNRKRKRPLPDESNNNTKTKGKEIHQDVVSSPDSKNPDPRAKKRKKNSRVTTSQPKAKKTTAGRKKNPKKSTPHSHDWSPRIDSSLLKNATIHPATTTATHNNNSEDEEEEAENDEKWNAMYAKLKAFHERFGHCKVPRGHNPDLSYWVTYTRRRMRFEEKRAGARALTLREEKLLNDLDFDPVYKEIVTEFNKYLGMRVAKLFDVVVDGSDDEDESDEESTVFSSTSARQKDGQSKYPKIKKKPFFGTVGRISSVCNRYLRIKYDDGDSEDFDKACLLEGLKLYKKYKHKDVAPPPPRRPPRDVTGKKSVSRGAEEKNADITDSNGDTTDALGQTIKIVKAVITPETSASARKSTDANANANAEKEPRSSDGGNTDNAFRNINGNDTGGDSSSEEVEILGVVRPYRCDPNLLGTFSKMQDNAVDNQITYGNNGFNGTINENDNVVRPYRCDPSLLRSFTQTQDNFEDNGMAYRNYGNNGTDNAKDNVVRPYRCDPNLLRSFSKTRDTDEGNKMTNGINGRNGNNNDQFGFFNEDAFHF